MQDSRLTVKGPIVLDGRYLVVRTLRSGPWGASFLVREVALGDWRELAVPASGSTDAARWRLVRAARSLARLQHDHVLQVHEVLNVAGAPALVTELATGGTVEEWIGRNAAIPPRVAAELGLRIVGAVEACHAAEVVHGDIQPGSLFVRADGNVALGGFGSSIGLGRGSPDLRTETGPDAGLDVRALGETLRRMCVSGGAADEVSPAAPLMEAVARCGDAGDPRQKLADVRSLLERAVSVLPTDRAGGKSLQDRIATLPDDPFLAWEADDDLELLRDRLALAEADASEGITQQYTPVPDESSTQGGWLEEVRPPEAHRSVGSRRRSANARLAAMAVAGLTTLALAWWGLS